MEIQKKSIPRIISVIILISMIAVTFAALQSCENDIDPDYIDFESEIQNKQSAKQSDAKVEIQESTDKLTVYMTIDNERFLIPAINIFKEKYPEVEVEIVEFTSEVISSGNSTLTTTPDEFRIRLNTELAAGQGPDLILADTNDFSDIYKTMASGIFADLNQFIEQDSEFNMDEYNKTVLDIGVYQEKRYIMPYDYHVPVLITTQEILDTEGITPDDLSTFDGFIRVTEKYSEKYRDNVNKSLFRNWASNRSNLNNIFSVCGIYPVNYQTNKPEIDKAKFKNIMDIMKKMYVSEEGSIAGDNMIEREGLKSQYWLFRMERYGNNISPTYQLHDWLVMDNLTPLYFKYPNIDNGVTAEVRFFGAIPASSKNQVSAYNLLKIILSEEIQSETMYIFGNPVLKSAVKVRAEMAMSITQMSHLKDEKSIQEYLNILINVDSCIIMPNALRNFVLEEMESYFKGTRSFDDCYDRLLNKLEIYISE